MGRLIDADAFERSVMFGDAEDMQDVIYALRDYSTVYDPDKVVEQLEERTAFLNGCTKYDNETAEQQKKSYDTMMMYEVKDLVDDLLEIVKEGGVDGNLADFIQYRNGSGNSGREKELYQKNCETAMGRVFAL